MKQFLIHGEIVGQKECIIKDMIEKEYQFAIETNDDSGYIAFHKGVWDVQINDEDIVGIYDTPEVVNGSISSWAPFDNKNEMSLSQAFIQSRIEYHLTKDPEKFSRGVPAAAIYDYLKLRLHLEEIDTFSIFVHQSSRDGMISDFKK